MIESFTTRLNSIAGTEKLEGFSLKEMFSEVFKRRPAEEVEEYFLVGTPKTTPAIEYVQTGWPKPWFFARVLMFLGIAVARAVSPGAGLIVAGYLVVSLTYSLYFKTKPLVDIFMLSLLYTVRLYADARAHRLSRDLDIRRRRARRARRLAAPARAGGRAARPATGPGTQGRGPTGGASISAPARRAKSRSTTSSRSSP